MFNRSASDLDVADSILSFDFDGDELHHEVRLGSAHIEAHLLDLTRCELELLGVECQLSTSLAVGVSKLLQCDFTSDNSLVLELYLLCLGGVDRDELEVDQGLKLDVSCGSCRMEMQLIGLFGILSANLYHIVEITILISLKRNIHLNGETRCNWPLGLIVKAELASLGLHEFYPAHLLANVADSHCHLIALVWLDIYMQILFKMRNGGR